MCVVVGAIETRMIVRLTLKPKKRAALCGRHLERLLNDPTVATERLAIVRSVLKVNTYLHNGTRCVVCHVMATCVERLRFTIWCLDVRTRFQKALELAPMFCRHHSLQMASRTCPENFVHIEERKIQALINDAGQAQLRYSPDNKNIIDRTIAYLALAPVSAGDNSFLREQTQPSDVLTKRLAIAQGEFFKFEAEQQLERIGKLESELASLRYRTSILDEENRALKRARIAQEATLRALERDRIELRTRLGEHFVQKQS